MIERLEAMLATGQDGPALRFALAGRYYAAGVLEKALTHATVAVELDADYSAAWRLLGQIQVAAGLEEEAAATFKRGIDVAEKRGDKQAAREMSVFLKRLKKQQEGSRDDGHQ